MRWCGESNVGWWSETVAATGPSVHSGGCEQAAIVIAD
jgi:hypothetical protein